MPRGRPQGSLNRPASVAKYFPKNWTPVHEAVVMAVLAGNSQKDVAAIYQISEVHVGNLMKSPQALELRNKLFDNLQKEKPALVDRIQAAQDKAMQRIEETLENDLLSKAQPLLAGNFALRVLQSIGPKGVVNSPGSAQTVNNTQINTTILTNPEFLNDIKEGLALSNRVAEIQTEAANRLLNGQ